MVRRDSDIRTRRTRGAVLRSGYRTLERRGENTPDRPICARVTDGFDVASVFPHDPRLAAWASALNDSGYWAQVWFGSALPHLSRHVITPHQRVGVSIVVRAEGTESWWLMKQALRAAPERLNRESVDETWTRIGPGLTPGAARQLGNTFARRSPSYRVRGWTPSSSRCRSMSCRRIPLGWPSTRHRSRPWS